MTNIQIIFDLCSHVLKCIVGYCCHSMHYKGLQLLKVVVLDLVSKVWNHLNHTMPNG